MSLLFLKNSFFNISFPSVPDLLLPNCTFLRLPLLQLSTLASDMNVLSLPIQACSPFLIFRPLYCINFISSPINVPASSNFHYCCHISDIMHIPTVLCLQKVILIKFSLSFFATPSAPTPLSTINYHLHTIYHPFYHKGLSVYPFNHQFPFPATSLPFILPTSS